MTTKKNGANESAKKSSKKAAANVNVRANVQSKTNKETETQKAARKAERAQKLEAQKAATAERHENAKSACSFNMYGLFGDYGKTQKFGACKLFYTSMQNVCGGAILTVLAAIIGDDKRDFAERYADKVEAKRIARKYTKYSAYVVWLALWDDLKAYTMGQAKADAQILAAIETLKAAADARKNK